MSLSVGIVGLPNVGKSTLFNALTNLNVEAANYPFATIEPNVGIVPVPDVRLEKLAKLEDSKEIVPTIIEFKDIAGLVEGAHKGEGLGNKFLSHIREVDAILEVVRLFDDPNVTHIAGKIDPERDVDTIATELALADLQMIETKLKKHERPARSGDKEEVTKYEVAKKYHKALSEGLAASTVALEKNEKEFSHEFSLLTNKPTLYLANTSSEKTPDILSGMPVVTLDAKLEAELSTLSPEEKQEYLKDLGLFETGLDKLINGCYKLLNLITFFTVGPKETKAWTCVKGTLAPQAAGIIHTDFEKGFIKAEVINWQTLLDAGGYSHARDKGQIRTEGKNYEIQDGDVVHFLFNN